MKIIRIWEPEKYIYRNKRLHIFKFHMWLVNVGWLPGNPQAALLLSVLNRTGRENKMNGQDTDGEITQ